MTWVKLDDGFPEHPKILGLSDAAFRLHLRAICYAARNLTDGVIPRAWLVGAKAKAVSQLVATAIWAETAEGYQIHDYLNYQQSRAHVQEQRAQAMNRMQLARSRHVRANKDGTSSEVPEKFAQPRLDPDPGEILKNTDLMKPRSQSQTPPSGGGLIMSPLEYAKLERLHTFIGSRLLVPHKLHQDFRRDLGGVEPDAVLRTWYAEVNEEIERTGEAIVPDIWKWLTARFKVWAVAHAGSAEMQRFMDDAS